MECHSGKTAPGPGQNVIFILDVLFIESIFFDNIKNLMKNNNKLEAVIFDLSGTIVDFGSLATILAMKKLF